MARDKPKAHSGPMYCAMYPDLAELARGCGYALAVHGSIARDFDLIAVPWAEKPAPSYILIAKIVGEFALRVVGEPEVKMHGREVWTLTIGFGDCFLDLSFMPREEDNAKK